MVKEKIDIEGMNAEELDDFLTNIINSRENYPENSTNKKALKLDDMYTEVSNMISEISEMISIAREYITDSIQRLEEFSDIEICNSDDNTYAHEEMDRILDEMSFKDLSDMTKRMNSDDTYKSYKEVFWGEE